MTDGAEPFPKMTDEPVKASTKGRAVPLVRPAKQTKKQAEKQAADALGAEQSELAKAEQTQAQASAARLAQIVNLHIAGHSLSAIGAAIGASAEEVDRMLATDAQRYIRSQPALRTYVRNWVSERYTKMLEADWDQATDAGHREKLEHQDRVFRILDGMRKLHGADAPTQTEVSIEAAPEAVEKLVSLLAANQGLGYDVDVFDTVPGEVVHAAPEAAHRALEQAGRDVENDQPGDEAGL